MYALLLFIYRFGLNTCTSFLSNTTDNLMTIGTSKQFMFYQSYTKKRPLKQDPCPPPLHLPSLKKSPPAPSQNNNSKKYPQNDKKPTHAWQ